MSREAASKRPTNVSINEELLAKAHHHGINLSAILEDALKQQIRSREQVAWKEENKIAIEAYNRFIEDNGVFSEHLRKF